MKNSVIAFMFACLIFSFSIGNIISQEENKKNDETQFPDRQKLLEEKIARLTKMLENEDDEIRLKAINEISHEPSTNIVPLAIKALKDRNATVRRKAMYTIKYLRDKTAIEAVMDVMFDSDYSVRSSAAEYMGDQKVIEAIPNLILLLQDENTHVKDNAYYSLISMGSPAVPALIKELKNENTHNRFYACEILGRIKDESALPALFLATEEVYVDKNLPNIQIAAIEALGNIGSTKAIPTLTKFIGEENNPTCQAAIESLGRIGGEKAATALIKLYYSVKYKSSFIEALGNTESKTVTPLLIKALKNRDDYIRSKACYALQKIKDKSSESALIKTLADESYRVREDALEALISLNVNGLTRLIRDTFVRETDQDTKIRFAQKLVYYNAFEGLEDEVLQTLIIKVTKYSIFDSIDRRNELIPFGEKAIDALINILNTSKNVEIKRHIVKLLADFPGEKVVNIVCEMLFNENESVRASAVSSLGEIGDERAITSLEKYMNSDKFVLDGNFINTVFRIGGDAARKILENLFESLEDLKLKIYTATRLVQLRSITSKEMYDYLLKSIYHLDKEIVSSAYWSLGDIGDNKALPHLVKSLKTEPLEYSVHAFRALQFIGDMSVIEDLLEFFDDPKYSMHKKALLRNVTLCAGIIDKKYYIELLDDGNQYLQSFALNMLSNFYKENDYNDYYLNLLTRLDPKGIAAAISYLGRTENQSYIDTILPYVTNANDDIRRYAIYAIGQLGGTKSEIILINGLNDKDEKIRANSAKLIMINKQKSAEETLKERFKIECDSLTKIRIAGALIAIGADKDGDMRRYVCKAKYREFRSAHLDFWLIKELDLKEAAPELIKSLKGYNFLDRIQAASTLVELGIKSAIPAIKEAYENSNAGYYSSVKVDLAIALMKLGYKDGIKLVLNELQNTSNSIRKRVIEALGEYANASVITELQKVIEEDYAFLVREAAKEAIKEIQSRNK